MNLWELDATVAVAAPEPQAEFPLRPYQQAALDAILEALRENRSTLAVMPTGTGKTVLLAHVIRHMPQRVMVLAHRQELLDQLQATIRRVTGRDTSLDQAENYGARSGENDVVIASVQTQISRYGDLRRYERFDAHGFSLVIIDEAHHAVAPSYRRVIRHMTQHEHVRVLGVTATPDRADEAALGQVFESVAVDYEIVDAIRDGWLVPVRQHFCRVTGLDYSHCRTTCGDLNQGDLERILEADRILDEMAAPIAELAGRRKTLVFCVSVAQARAMTDLLNIYELDSARVVTGTTPAEERKRIIADYRAGRFRFLVNVGVATEGFDVPDISFVVCARPTKSRALYAQMIGRGTRPLPGLVDACADAEARRAAIAASPKPAVEVLDFTGNSGRHKLISTYDILGGRVSDEVVERARRRAERRGVPVDVLSDLSDEELLAQQEERQRQQERRRRLRQQVRVSAEYVLHQVDPFDWLDIRPARERAWHRNRPLSDKMIAMLRRYNVQYERLNYTQAQQVIGEIIRRDLPTPKQVCLLQRYGIETDGMTFHKAGELITRIANNGWRYP